jgi:negative regulator of genetic competence, sporulation and motility
MKASEFTTEDNFGTHPKRPARTGSRHPRGHQPVPRYKTITAQDSDNTAESVAEGSESSIEKKIQAKQDSLSLAREQRRARGQRQQGQREIKLQAEIDKLNTELTQLKQQGVAEGKEEEKIGGRYDANDFDDMVARLKKLAGAGPMKTVYDPDRRVYRNMPTAQQPAQQPKKAPR